MNSRNSPLCSTGDRVANVRAMSPEHLDAVVTLHLTCFPNARSSFLGPLFVRSMYGWFLTHQPALSFIYAENGQVVGFLTGVTGGYGRRMFRDTWPVIACCLIMRPSLWVRRNTFKLWRSYLRGFLPRRSRPLVDASTTATTVVTASVASIAVLPETRGLGVGRALLAAFERQAKDLGARRLQLTVEADNVDAQQVYEKTGWQLSSTGPFGRSYAKVFIDHV